MSWISCGDCVSISVVPDYVNEYAANNTIWGVGNKSFLTSQDVLISFIP